MPERAKFGAVRQSGKMYSMNFSEALDKLKSGSKMYREGWYGNMVGVLQTIDLQIPDENSKMTEPYIYMEVILIVGSKVKDIKRCPWLASQVDLLAEDWQERK